MHVLVTRAPADAARTATELEALGFQAVLAPVTRIVATGVTPPTGLWSALIVTSLHAAEALSLLPDRSIPVFAVGPRTAEAVREVGFAHIRIAEGDAISLSALIRGQLAPAASLLHITARHHKEEPAASLRAAGYSVTLWEAYEAEAVESLPATGKDALRAGRIAAVLHYSRRSAELFLGLATDADLIASLRAAQHLCLSDDVAEPLRAMDLQVRVASTPDEPALLRLLAR
ncbi:uroporphyrinogen-III synthase [Microvirga brassicacearum]|uniref:Uroporphyrinogen-III synthase n=1 Tax=Microvirga brassicacearum TaxID=2580413 RepID=A0A5N3P9X1_9HYPH|nr:uroporphyrinogen-III synthase [Microvirga brassicacearum]KAB0266425.1 uroporphyrinogen-III synthase [Microvirga brassicacearum]